MAKFVFYVSTGYVGADIKETVEIPDEDLEGLSVDERDKVIQQEYDVWVSNNAELSWWPASGKDKDE